MTLLFNADQWSSILADGYGSTIRRGMRKVLPGPQMASCNGDFAVLHVKEVAFRFFKDLDYDRALHAGYDSERKLKQALADTYPGLQDLEIMTIITIDKVLLHHEHTDSCRPTFGNAED